MGTNLWRVFVILLEKGGDSMHRMYADFSDEAYEDMVNGEAKSNNGFRKNDGSFHPDQPDFVEIEDNDSDMDDNPSGGDVTAQIIALVVGVGITIGAAAAPHIKRLWNETIVPGVKKIYSKMTGKKSSAIEQVIESHTTSLSIAERTGVTAKEFSKNVDIAIEGFKKNMSSEEAQMHMLNIMKLAELLANEIRSLSGAVIEDDEYSGEYLEWKVAIEKLTTQQVTDSINYMLENNSGIFKGEQLQELSWIWGCKEIKEEGLLPVENEQIKEALSI